MYKSPLSPALWAESFRSLKKLKILVFCALCMATSVILGYFYIPVGENLSIKFTYLATATAGLVTGPVGAFAYGLAADLLDYMMHPSPYGFFFGYTLSAAVGAFFYGFFLYRQRVTVLRIALAKICVNYFVNVGMGALWSSMLLGKGYMYYLVKSLAKNTVMLPIEIFIIYIFFAFLLPALKGSGMLPPEQSQKIKWF